VTSSFLNRPTSWASFTLPLVGCLKLTSVVISHHEAQLIFYYFITTHILLAYSMGKLSPYITPHFIVIIFFAINNEYSGYDK
jgi:hypothetical protein